MTRLGPFEPRPSLAVGVSGGRDSMALALLADRWARARGGRIVALTVDHGLRPGSLAEARRVHGWLGARGIAHRILRWTGPKPAANVQSAARRARYRLLTAWCERHGVLHLLLAHQAEDQAETFLLRLARGSGVDGLACMAAVSELAPVRVLRPLLPIARVRLAATLRSAGQAWIDDPSNENTAHARIRLRRLQGALEAEGLTAARLMRTARHIAAARASSEAQVAALLARTARLHPAGFCEIDCAVLLQAPAATALRALSSVLQTIGGTAYPPRFERLERLYHALASGAGFTLAGCRILRQRASPFWLVCREPAAIGGAIRVAPGQIGVWDGRFTIARAGGRARRGGAPFTVRQLGAIGAGALAGDGPARRIPSPAMASLPALWDGRKLVAVPPIGPVSATLGARQTFICHFSPPEPLAGASFAVV
jgi:tRNA(Ile)-lysidine synthase